MIFSKIMQYWTQFSEDLLSEMEYRVLSNLKTPYKMFEVPIILDGVEEKIWTISLNTKSQNTPLVLLHGFAEGIGLWALNLDELARDRPVYAMDIIGFGKSSRPEFTTDCAKNERKFMDAIEEWRKYLELDTFHILGHSMGGYLATSYTLSYQNHVKHLILCDPWGFSDKYEENSPLWMEMLGYFFRMVNFNPLGILRCFGPFGPLYFRLFRQDVLKHYKKILKNDKVLPTYIFQCNAHPNPTGETAFYSMLAGIGWAKFPMIKRIDNLNDEIRITIMYASNTFMDIEIGDRIKNIRPRSYVDVQIIDDSGHHIYADNAEIFNKIVNSACSSSE